MQELDQGRVVFLILLDQGAAFDLVDHELLLQRLGTAFGVRGSVLEWIRSFLKGRKQFVSISGDRSDSRSVSSGVPQGSVIEPKLTPFLLHLSDGHLA